MEYKEVEKKLQKVFESNSTHTNIMKSIEELQELSLILTQYLNKRDIETDSIEEEIAHVGVRMSFLGSYFDENNIKKHIIKKTKQLYKNVNNR